MKKRKSIVLSLALATSLLCSATSFAKFQVGVDSRTFSYSGGNGSVSVMADVDTNAGGTYYKYKGDMYYSKSSKLTVVLEGNYDLGGRNLCESVRKTVPSGKTATKYLIVPQNGVGVCTSQRPCTCEGQVKGHKVKTAKFPKS